jgi:hypothetical protein
MKTNCTLSQLAKFAGALSFLVITAPQSHGQDGTYDHLTVNNAVGIGMAPTTQPLAVKGFGDGGYFNAGHISWLNPNGNTLGMIGDGGGSHIYGTLELAGDSTVAGSSRIGEVDAMERSFYPYPHGTDRRAFSLAFGRDGTGWAVDFISMNIPFNPIMHVTGTGNNYGMVGISTTTPGSKLSVNGNVAIGSYAASAPAPIGGLIVSGNVGFGTATPSQALEVNGNVKATQFIGDGSGLYVLPQGDLSMGPFTSGHP